jgi:hypothetical protein
MASVLATQTCHLQSRLERLPRELRDIIYEELGLATKTVEADFSGVKVHCRHEFF